MGLRLWAVVMAALFYANGANAANYPCSGSKGGISHCLGKFFVCKNGTTSQSKKDCSATWRSGDDAEDDESPPARKKR